MRHDPIRGRGRLNGRVLIIAGSDSGGGAGIQADIKAIMAMDGYAATAITAITAQNTVGVHEVVALPPAMVRAQIAAVLDDIGADAVKTGMLGDCEVVGAVADEIGCRARGVPLVVDPVMVAKGGASLLADEAVGVLRARLLPLATVVTPNLPEAEVLLGQAITDPVAAVLALHRLTGTAVLLKGGHAEGPVVADILADAEGLERFESPRIPTRHTHGTGCTLASAIAAGLAQGLGLRGAIGRAHRYLQAAIAQAPGFGRGHGPLNHNVRLVSGGS